ncbi:HEAT repeat domain-containing protein [bacterium]|nr:HEAT repeat domain-containing protein [bacterium]
MRTGTGVLGWVLFGLAVPLWAGEDMLPLQRKTGPDEGRSSIIAPKKDPEGKPYVPPPPIPSVQSVGTYGSPRINEVMLKDLLGKDLDLWIVKGLASDPSAVDMEKTFVDKIKKKYGFPFAEWSIIQYFQPDGLAMHITLDVVEQADVARRMPFLAAPNENIPDPDGLIKQWMEYETIALELVENGSIQPEKDRCVALHCPFGHKHDKLKKFEKIFVDGVKKNAAALMQVQTRDRHPEARGAATYLLAYLSSDKKKVVDAMVDRIRDPDPLVRNNALRVLGDIAEFHPEVPIPLKPLVPVLDFPRVSDRSKALYAILLLALNSNEVRAELLRSSVPTLISLMECKQPDHRDLAHTILRKISGKDFADNDIRPWVAWYRKLPPAGEISKK